MNLKHVLAAATMAVSAAASADVTVAITNLTQSITFTPFIVTAHDADFHFFQVGDTASAGLQAMAEGGDVSGLLSQADAAGAVSITNPNKANGNLLQPGMSVTTTAIANGDLGYLSMAAMLLPTNDGFAALDAWPIPVEAGEYTIYLNAYDAGTEVNDEIIVGASGGAPGVPGIPANPSGNGGVNATGVTTTEVNGFVHIHPGNVGDVDANGGISDVDSRIHRWLNPVLKVVVTVQ
jgi:hypothetical protein